MRIISKEGLCMAKTGCIVYREDGKVVQLHRMLLVLQKGDKVVDHVNRCRTNNGRINLRLVPYSQNNKNKMSKRQKSSSYQGVTWHALRQKWAVRITINYASKHLGLFMHEIDVAKAYNHYCEQHLVLPPLPLACTCIWARARSCKLSGVDIRANVSANTFKIALLHCRLLSNTHLRCLHRLLYVLHTCYGLLTTAVPHPGIHKQDLPHRCCYGRRWTCV